MTIRTCTKVTTATALTLAISLGSSVGWSTERQLDSHEHGVSTLKIAQEGNKVTLELEAPGDDIVGFEYEPKNEAEKASVEAALTKLRKPEALFSMPSAAGCSVAESEAEFETSKDHAGFHVTWSLKCQTIIKANSLQVRFFDAFPNAREIEVEAIGSIGQMSAEVEKGTTSVDLSKAFGA